MSEFQPQSQPAQNKPVKVDLYAKHIKIYPREDHGLFNKLRDSAVFILLAIFYAFPWLNWNGRQAILWDLPDRKFYIFDVVIWPQDFFFLAALMIIAALPCFSSRPSPVASGVDMPAHKPFGRVLCCG